MKQSTLVVPCIGAWQIAFELMSNHIGGCQKRWQSRWMVIRQACQSDKSQSRRQMQMTVEVVHRISRVSPGDDEAERRDEKAQQRSIVVGMPTRPTSCEGKNATRCRNYQNLRRIANHFQQQVGPSILVVRQLNAESRRK